MPPFTATVRQSLLTKRKPFASILTLTPKASLKLSELYQNTNTDRLLKISQKQKGCSGNAYILDWSLKSPLDEVVEIEGLKLLVDNKALIGLIGSEMDWVDGKLSEGFVFSNPNIKGTCGCGQSFLF